MGKDKQKPGAPQPKPTAPRSQAGATATVPKVEEPSVTIPIGLYFRDIEVSMGKVTFRPAQLRRMIAEAEERAKTNATSPAVNDDRLSKLVESLAESVSKIGSSVTAVVERVDKLAATPQASGEGDPPERKKKKRSRSSRVVIRYSTSRAIVPFLFLSES